MPSGITLIALQNTVWPQTHVSVWNRLADIYQVRQPIIKLVLFLTHFFISIYKSVGGRIVANYRIVGGEFGQNRAG